MNYRFMIARRYLTSPRSVSLISRITGISVVGVALGVAALIVVLSVLNGFFEFVRDMLVSYDPHIRIVSLEEVTAVYRVHSNNAFAGRQNAQWREETLRVQKMLDKEVETYKKI